MSGDSKTDMLFPPILSYHYPYDTFLFGNTIEQSPMYPG